MVGLDGNDPSYQRGFTLFLPDNGGTIWVYGEVNSEDTKDLRSLAATRIDDLSKESGVVASAKYNRLHMDGHIGEHVSAEFRCALDLQAYGYLADFAMDRSRRFLYTILWEGPVAGTSSAEQTLGALERAWRFIPAR